MAKNGMWNCLDDAENGIISEGLQKTFDQNPMAFKNYHNFSREYRKTYLY